MYQGNWTCSKCGAAITELPFMPKSEAGLTCRACYTKSKDTAGSPASRDSSQSGNVSQTVDSGAAESRPQFKGNWKCSNCGAAITSLPFEPKSTSNLKCRNCFTQR